MRQVIVHTTRTNCPNHFFFFLLACFTIPAFLLLVLGNFLSRCWPTSKQVGQMCQCSCFRYTFWTIGESYYLRFIFMLYSTSTVGVGWCRLPRLFTERFTGFESFLLTNGSWHWTPDICGTIDRTFNVHVHYYSSIYFVASVKLQASVFTGM